MDGVPELDDRLGNIVHKAIEHLYSKISQCPSEN